MFFFQFWEGSYPFLSLLPFPMSCPVSLPLMTCLTSPSSYDCHYFLSTLESATDSGSDSPGLLESDTTSVAFLSPSGLAYDASSVSEVASVVPLPSNLGSRPCYNVKQRPTIRHLGQRGQGILMMLTH